MEKFAAGVACEADSASVQRGKEGERWKAVPAPQGADGRAGYRMAARTTARRAVIMSFSCDSAIPTTAAQTVARSYFYASPALGVNARFCRDEDGARPRRQLELDVLCAAPSPAVAAVDRDRVGDRRSLRKVADRPVATSGDEQHGGLHGTGGLASAGSASQQRALYWCM
jgi:hypothetical protein